MIEADVLASRAVLYRLLGALYHYPLTPAKLHALRLCQADHGSPLAAKLEAMQKALDGVENGLIERLNIEMTRLLEGPGMTPAPPYASYYLHGGQLMGPAAQTARRAYLAWGVEPDERSIPPDHIALELGFLAFLAEQALTDDVGQQMKALRAAHTFLHEAVQPWLPAFCAALATHAREPFFVALAALTHLVVEKEQAWLEATLMASDS